MAEIQPLAFRIDDACRALGIGRTSIYRLIANGKLQSIRIAGRTLIATTEIERLISEANNNKY